MESKGSNRKEELQEISHAVVKGLLREYIVFNLKKHKDCTLFLRRQTKTASCGVTFKVDVFDK